MNLYELFIGFRYLKSKKNQAFISFNTLLSIFIVFIGVFILIIVISVMNGFQAQIKDKILDVDSHITVMAYNSGSTETGMSNYNRVSETIKEYPEVVSAVPYFQGQGILRDKNKISAVLIRGVGEGNDLPPDFKKYVDVVRDDFPDCAEGFSGIDEVFVGLELAEMNHILIGETIEVIVAKGQFSVVTGSTPGVEKLKVVGYFKTGYYEFDTNMIITSLPTAQKIYDIPGRVWGIGVKIRDIFRMDQVASSLQSMLGYEFQVYTAEDRNQNLFYALNIEKFVMTVILFLVIVSAGFTIMGTLVMVVMEKRKAIGVLKSMGASPYSIMTIFVLEGFFIGLIGTVCGLCLGLATAINLETIILFIENVINVSGAWIFATFDLAIWTDIHIVPTHVYYIDHIPSEIKPGFVSFIAVFAVFLSTVAAIFPAWHASRLKPVETIRYE